MTDNKVFCKDCIHSPLYVLNKRHGCYSYPIGKTPKPQIYLTLEEYKDKIENSRCKHTYAVYVEKVSDFHSERELDVYEFCRVLNKNNDCVLYNDDETKHHKYDLMMKGYWHDD